MDNEVYFKEYKERLRKRMQENGINDNGIALVFGLMKKSFCSENASLYAIGDYLDTIGY